eukprot:TRINITY_DN8809_c0_g1_i2.p1 TRINITY_DN8809_c0_g1~~TRINITY_DN8809_c0_g1_i2.p1  ORF type:complete len:167 (-),score=22.05 TRINITY_DN8809_c0_g1_i2:333-833(-)
MIKGGKTNASYQYQQIAKNEEHYAEDDISFRSSSTKKSTHLFKPAAPKTPTLAPEPSANSLSNEQFLQEQLQKQEESIKEQDEILEDMSTVLGRLQQMGTEMSDELHLQNQMISDITVRVEEADSQMVILQKKVETLMNQSGRGPFCLMIFLSFVILVLILLIVLT